MGVSQPCLIRAQKSALRLRMRAWRAALQPRVHSTAAVAAARQGLAFLQPLTAGSVISAFAPLPGEFQVWRLLGRLRREGYALALPVMHGKGRPLIFRAWEPGDAMDSGVWGIAEPRPDKPTLVPDVLIVPLLAFDPQGWRLGYGGGYYDRTLRELRALKRIVAVGIAHDEQAVDAVPHLDYDERLDWVLTPSGPIRCVA